jgi:Flp pilus assembly protein TadG
MKGTFGLRLRRSRSGQSGAAVIEFAFVFPLMLGVAYAGIVYGYFYFLQQSLNFAAQQGAQAAIATLPVMNGASGNVAKDTAAAQQVNASAAIVATLNWLPSTAYSVPATAPDCRAPASATSLGVEVLFPTAGVFPVLPLPFLGNFPYMPTNLLGCAVAYSAAST